MAIYLAELVGTCELRAAHAQANCALSMTRTRGNGRTGTAILGSGTDLI